MSETSGDEALQVTRVIPRTIVEGEPHNLSGACPSIAVGHLRDAVTASSCVELLRMRRATLEAAAALEGRATVRLLSAVAALLACPAFASRASVEDRMSEPIA